MSESRENLHLWEEPWTSEREASHRSPTSPHWECREIETALQVIALDDESDESDEEENKKEKK